MLSRPSHQNGRNEERAEEFEPSARGSLMLFLMTKGFARSLLTGFGRSFTDIVNHQAGLRGVNAFWIAFNCPIAGDEDGVGCAVVFPGPIKTVVHGASNSGHDPSTLPCFCHA